MKTATPYTMALSRSWALDFICRSNGIPDGSYHRSHTMTKLEKLQELRRDQGTCTGKDSSVYWWAMCIAINAYIGYRGNDQSTCVEGLAKALEAEVEADKERAAA